ncbi:MAG: hypothetical protein ABFS10_02800 [Bacteroidota bacterium]
MFRKSLALCLFLSLSPLLQAQDIHPGHQLGDTLVTDSDLFEGADPLELTLTFNLKQYQREKSDEKYKPVHLNLRVNDSLEIEKEVRIKPRGNFRRNHCTFAPFWLNIRKADVKNIHLQDVKRMKIVTHCQGGKDYTDYVLKEYLAYRIYNILSPVSFRVRLIRMKYVDTGRKNRVTESWAFMIEPEKMVAERHDAMVIKRDNLVMSFMRPDEIMLTSLFQYMIGNADYSIAGRHNMKILGLPGFSTEGYTPVPYDFDYSGFVNANYAVPGENLGIKSVRERYFLGPCQEDSSYREAITTLENKRVEILELLNAFPYLDERSRKQMVGYIEAYYISTEAPRFIDRNLRRTCR